MRPTISIDTVREPISDIDGAQDTVTDPSPSQTEPTEPVDGSRDTPGAGEERAPEGPRPPRWSEKQPEPAPWYVGRPGAVKPGGNGNANPGWPTPPDAPPNRPPNQDQGSGTGWGGQSGPGQGQGQGQSGQGGQNGQGQSGQNGQGGQGQNGGQGGQGQNGQGGDVPSWNGQWPGRGGQNGPGAPSGGGPGAPGQGGSGQRPQGPPSWHGYGQQPQRRPDGSGPGQRPGAAAEPRGPLDLRTRWARGLALGATACMLIALWYAYSDIAAFPTFLISAGVGLALGMVGLWLGVFAQRAAMRKNKRAPEAVSAIVWSSIAAFISLMILAYSMIFYSQLSQFSTCMRSATTIALQNKCVSDYENSYTGQG